MEQLGHMDHYLPQQGLQMLLHHSSFLYYVTLLLLLLLLLLGLVWVVQGQERVRGR